MGMASASLRFEAELPKGRAPLQGRENESLMPTGHLEIKPGLLFHQGVHDVGIYYIM